uniref:Uncharacterized protein n=1 Tax=Arundo donax TaxID=35708 RepID=A0A0A9GJF3_ARUDO
MGHRAKSTSVVHTRLLRQNRSSRGHARLDCVEGEEGGWLNPRRRRPHREC